MCDSSDAMSLGKLWMFFLGVNIMSNNCRVIVIILDSESRTRAYSLIIVQGLTEIKWRLFAANDIFLTFSICGRISSFRGARYLCARRVLEVYVHYQLEF
jgi:hypothetical protein